jgi:hypothetical protein
MSRKRKGPMAARVKTKARSRARDMREAKKDQAERERLQQRNSIFPEAAVKKMVIHW